MFDLLAHKYDVTAVRKLIPGDTDTASLMGEALTITEKFNEVICRRDPAKFRWLIDWLAHALQTTGLPSSKSPVSPVVWGPKGAGKSLPFDYIADLFANHGMTIANTEQLVGKFNKHLSMACFVVAEEAVYGKALADASPLKDLLTRSTLTVEPKGVDAFKVPNYCRFVFISNDKAAVPMTGDERRFQAFHVSDHKAGDAEYFNGIVEEMQDGGVAANRCA